MAGRTTPFPGQRGVASIIAFLICVSALFGFTTYVLSVQGRRAGYQARGLIDVMRDSQKRLNQLPCLVYSYVDAKEDDLHAYLYNYGTEGVWVENVWMNGHLVSPADVGWSNPLRPGELKLLTVSNVSSYASGEGSSTLVVLTRSNTLYSWEVG